ncbi:MAG: PEP/pyruvate-binding domain-containing protein, partial [Kofleriaceae bacterium]
MPAQSILWFDDVSRSSTPVAGGKGANLGEMTRAGLPVPPGFIVTVRAFTAAVEAAGIRQRLAELFAAANPDDPAQLADASREIRRLIQQLALPADLRAQLARAYAQLGDRAPVAVRSSATAEDTSTTSFAGMHETFTDVVGEDALVDRLKACWASAYSERAIAYRKAQHITEEPTLAVVVQRMVRAERSGVLFTVDPAHRDREHLVIEAAFGLGEVVVGGQVEPDTYIVARQGPRVLDAHVGHKAFEIERGPEGADHRVELDERHASQRVLADDEVLALSSLGLEVERHYGAPQDLEWAEEGGHWYLVQTRPITTLSEPAAEAAEAAVAEPGAVRVSGLGAAP